jgi:L-alanine-DL-glutamate epimerase-like enolase superfamily enzyme
MHYDQIAGLDLQIDGYGFERRERDTSSDFRRRTTVVSLHGDGETGRGEDVTYESEDHETFEGSPKFPFTGTYTCEEFSAHVGDIDLFAGAEPSRPVFRNYRRWAVESAALDLALKQAGTNLAAQLDRAYDPVRFVASTRLGEPPTADRVRELLEHNPDIEFKLDPTPEWSEELIEELVATEAVRILDLKGLYEGTEVDQEPDPDLYERLIEAFPSAVIEDPALTESTRPLFDGEKERVSWDYPIHGVEDVEALPWEPSWLNIKPSRFGSVASLLETVEYCHEREIRLYGGGQFELDVGRQHLHALASLFYPDGPNDVAPRVYNDPEVTENLPQSPLTPPAEPRGLEWEYQ